MSMRVAAAAFGLVTESRPLVRMGGAINRVFRVAAVGGDVAVRIHRPETTPGRLAAIHRIQDSLRAGGVPIPRVRVTPGGRRFVDVRGQLVEVLDFVPGGHEVATWDDARLLLDGLGRFHGAGRHLEADSLALIELVESLEEELSDRTVGFRIEDEDLEDLKTVRDAVDYVHDRVG